MLRYLHIVRPLNLLIVALSQLLIFYFYITPLFAKHGLEQLLTGPLMWLFILDTVCIAAAGYVINDIYDSVSDQVNKPQKSYIGVKNISLRSAWMYYTILCIAGGALALYIAISIARLPLFVIYPAATLLLFMYSKVWKRRPLSGNIVVAIFCAFVPGIIWYAEASGMNQLSEVEPSYVLLFAMYIIFGFLATLARELIKDLEDENGDRAAGYSTFAIEKGADKARVVAQWLITILISSYGLWFLALWRLADWLSLSLVVILMLAPSIAILLQTIKSQEKKDYSLISKHLKFLMLASLIVFIVTLIHI